MRVCVCLSLDFSLYIYDVQCYLSIHSLTHPLTYSLIPSLGPIFLQAVAEAVACGLTEVKYA